MVEVGRHEKGDGMEQKRSVGLIAVAILKLLYVVVILFALTGAGLESGGILSPYIGEIGGVVFASLFILVYVISVVCILFLKELARKINIGLDSIFIFHNLIAFLPNQIKEINKPYMLQSEFIFSLVLYFIPIFFIYYLTRPNVKEQFK